MQVMLVVLLLIICEDDPEVYHGAPATVQLIGRRLDEERLLSMAQLVVDALEQYKTKHGELH